MACDVILYSDVALYRRSAEWRPPVYPYQARTLASSRRWKLEWIVLFMVDATVAEVETLDSTMADFV